MLNIKRRLRIAAAIGAALVGVSCSDSSPPQATLNSFIGFPADAVDATLTDRIGVHRSFNPSGPAHFYTTDAAEAAQPGLEVEALDYFYLAATQAEGLSPFFRCRKSNGTHFYTVSDTCENAAAVREDILGFIAHDPAPGLTPLYRLYSPHTGGHLYTVRADEKRGAMERYGYRDEGVAGYVLVPPFYITPVAETSDPSVLEDMKSTFGVAHGGGNIVLGWSRSTWYMGEVRSAAEDYAYDPAKLHKVFEIAIDKELPLVINMNGGRWSGGGPLVDYLRNPMASGSPTVALDQNGAPMFSFDFGRQYFSLSRLNRTYYQYKKRNLQAAAAEVAAFRALHPVLFVGVSLDSETMLGDPSNPSRYGDYNPMAIEEWRQWLSGTGLYDPVDGEYAGQARSPVFASIEAFNAAMGTAFTRWSNVRPPRRWDESPAFWLEWRIWGITMVAHHTRDMASWIESAGIPRAHIFNHQTPGLAPLFYGDDLATAVLFGGLTAGITALGDTASDGNLIRYVRGRSRHVGIFEWNPLGDAQAQYRALTLAYHNTVRVIAPYHWPVDIYFPVFSIKGSATEIALRDFIRDHAADF